MDEKVSGYVTQERANLMEFKKEVEGLINKYSLENISDTPDFIIAEYLVECLENFSRTIKHREKWYSKD